MKPSWPLSHVAPDAPCCFGHSGYGNIWHLQLKPGPCCLSHTPRHTDTHIYTHTPHASRPLPFSFPTHFSKPLPLLCLYLVLFSPVTVLRLNRVDFYFLPESVCMLPVSASDWELPEGKACVPLMRTENSFFFFPCLFRATSAAHGTSQARRPIGATGAGLHHSHSHMGSQPHL